ncbi:MAG: RDD family protein [Promethearchaeota archaeon]
MSYQPADQIKRLIAYIIDSIILGVVAVIVILVVTVPLAVLGYSVGLFDLIESLGEDIITDPAALFAVISIVLFYIIILVATQFVFWVIIPTIMNGQTIGKKVMNLQIRKLMPDGSTESTGGMFGTHLLRWIGMVLWDFSGVLYCLDLILILVTEKRQRIGDFIAGTVVVE